jgi:hypothetical protein
MENKTPLDQDFALPKTFVEWFSPAYRKTEKGMAWYVLMGLVVLAFVLYGLLSGEGGWVISITFLVLAGAYYLSEMKPAPVLKVTISDHGIRYGTKTYQYSDIRSFWIINDEGVRSLHLRLYKGSIREVSIMIPEELNLSLMRDYLLLQLTEEVGRKENVSDKLIRNLGL